MSMVGEMIRVMFVADGAPLSEVRVRAGGEDVWTDSEGFVEVELGVGEHVLAVEREEGSWLNAAVEVGATGGIVVADVSVSKPTTGMFAIAQLAGVQSQSFGDRYTFERVLGRGGMGVVVKAQDTLLARPVAIKMLNDEFEDNEEAQNIFLTEARAIATLAHPNLVAIYDVAMIDNRAMIVFEFVEGSNLEDVFNEHEKLREGEMLRVGIQLGNALAYLHGEGVIHRDLKPGNAIVQSDGTVRLIDFGLARSLETLENKGTRVRGTPAYMSPEQILGGELGPPADMYQFGVTLYEVVAGRLPFTTGNMGFAHVHQQPPPVDAFAPDLSADVARIIDRCLAKEPEMRPTAKELVAVFEHVYVDRKSVFDGQTRAMPALHVTGAMRAITPTIDSEPMIGFELEQPSEDEQEEGRRGGVLLWAMAGMFALASLGVGVWWATREVSEVGGELVARDSSSADALAPPVDAPVLEQDAPVVRDGLPEAVERGASVVEEGVDVAEARVERAAPDARGEADERPANDASDVDDSSNAARTVPRGKPRVEVGDRSDTKASGGDSTPSNATGSRSKVEKKDEVPDAVPRSSGSDSTSNPTSDSESKRADAALSVVKEPKEPAEPAGRVAEKPSKPEGDGVGAKGDDDEGSEKKKVRRVIRKKVIRKKETAVPRSF